MIDECLYFLAYLAVCLVVIIVLFVIIDLMSSQSVCKMHLKRVADRIKNRKIKESRDET